MENGGQVFYPFQYGDRLILTSEDGPRTERIEKNYNDRRPITYIGIQMKQK